jgi:hypothetical protein
VRGRSSYFAAREAGSGPSRRSRYFAYGGFRPKQTKEIWAAPASGGVALYLAAKRPLDRARKRSQPIRVTIAPPRTATHATPASKTQPIRTGAFVSPACCSSSRINLYPVERQWLVPKSCILVAARLQDGWDSSRSSPPPMSANQRRHWSTPTCCIGSVVNGAAREEASPPWRASIPDAKRTGPARLGGMLWSSHVGRQLRAICPGHPRWDRRSKLRAVDDANPTNSRRKKGVSPPPGDPDTYYFAVRCSPRPKTVMSLGGSFCSLCLRVHYGWRRARV